MCTGVMGVCVCEKGRWVECILESGMWCVR